jgi:hypothetical protein
MNLEFTLNSSLGGQKITEGSVGTLAMSAASLDTLKVFGPQVFAKVHLSL